MKLSNISDKLNADYTKRINEVFKYIDDNLDGDLSLSQIAPIAFFSPFHFHRVFKFITGETLNEYVTRQRLEKSAIDLIHRNIGITKICLKWGFKDNSSFSRAFKKFYGVSPTAFRQEHPNKFSKIRQLKSKNGQAYPDREKYICAINNLKKWLRMNVKIEIKELPNFNVAFVSSIGSQNLEGAFEKLIRWGTPKGLINDEAKLMTVYYDSFKVTEAHKVRMNACLQLSTGFEVGNEIETTSLEGGKCIVGNYEITPNEFEKAWTGLFLWMHDNGYQKADRHPFEVYHNDFRKHPEGKFIVDLCIPIK